MHLSIYRILITRYTIQLPKECQCRIKQLGAGLLLVEELEAPVAAIRGLVRVRDHAEGEGEDGAAHHHYHYHHHRHHHHHDYHHLRTGPSTRLEQESSEHAPSAWPQ